MPVTPAAGKLPPLKPGEFRFTTKAFTTEMVDGRRRFHTIASSTIKDLGNDEMQITALEDMAAAFRAGLVIFMNHKYEVPENSFGMSDSAEIRDSGTVDEKTGSPIWDMHIGGFVDESNPRAIQLSDSIAGGMRFGASVGAIVKSHKRNEDGGMTIAHVDPKEASIVGIPQNQRSWVQKAAHAAERLETEGVGLGVEDDEDEASEAILEAETTEKAVDAEIETAAVEEPLAEAAEADVEKGVGCADCGHETDCSCEDCSCESALHHPGAQPEDHIASGEESLDIIKEATEGGQEADPAATPETAPDATEASDPAPVQKAVFDGDDVVELVRKTSRLVEVIGQKDEEIVRLRAELDAVKAERNQLASENEDAKTVIEKVMAQPLRPRAQGHVADFTKRYPDFLAPEVVNILNRNAGDA